MPNEINPSDPVADETLESATAAPSQPSGGVRRRLVLSFGATALGPLTSLLFQILNVRVFLRCWGPELYGEWLVLSAVPTYLAMSDMGFGTVAANDMTMRAARRDFAGALQTLQSTWALITVVSFGLLAAVVPVISLAPVTHWLQIRQIATANARFILIILAVDSLACLQTSISIAGFKAAGLNHYASFSVNAMRVVEGIGVLLAVSFHHGPVYVACVLMGVRALGNVVLAVLAKRSVPWLQFGFRYARWEKIRELFHPAIAFMAFPAANALALQGSVIAIGVILGPIAVSVFTPMRTMARTALQLSETLKNGAWPELSAAYGASDWALARRLHRMICQLSLVLSGVVAIVMAISGPWILRVWTHNRIAIDLPTFYLLNLDVIACCLWNASSALPLAANKHTRIAVELLTATTASLIVGIVLMKFFGLPGSAAGLLLGDIIMNFAIIPASLRLVADHMGSFVRSLFDLRALAARLARLRRAPVPAS